MPLCLIANSADMLNTLHWEWMLLEDDLDAYDLNAVLEILCTIWHWTRLVGALKGVSDLSSAQLGVSAVLQGSD